MARFPQNDQDLLNLANAVIDGVTANPGDYPNINVVALTAARDLFVAKLNLVNQLNSQLTGGIDEKDDARTGLRTDTRTAVDQAEIDTNNDKAKLQAIGWDTRADATPTVAQDPGQCGPLECIQQTASTATFNCAKPTEGGEVLFYMLQMRERPAGDWMIAGSDADGQNIQPMTPIPRAKEMEFRCIATGPDNRQGPPSNTVMVVL